VDEVAEIEFDRALQFAKKLMRLEGIPAGISSGAAVATAMEEAERHPDAVIVTILPDSARNYPDLLLKKSTFPQSS
jgi:cysteine synthase A